MNNLTSVSNMGYSTPQSSFSPYQSNQFLSGSKEFLESNSLVAKIAFLLLVIVVFIFTLRLGMGLLTWIFSGKSSPILIDGMIDSKQMLVIPQNPSSNDSIPIKRSSNEQDGIEFTWSTWIFIDDLTYKQGQYKHIFHKGNDNINLSTEPKGLNFPNNAPGLYIGPNSNTILIILNTFTNISEEIEIDNIPIKKWVNIIIRCNGSVIDVFINGTLSRRHILNGVVKQNYGDVFVSMNGGFDGYTSSLRYFDKAISTSNIQSIINDGPNLKIKTDDLKTSKPPYLSLRWYFFGNENSYNP
jgi:hypothetical protein